MCYSYMHLKKYKLDKPLCSLEVLPGRCLVPVFCLREVCVHGERCHGALAAARHIGSCEALRL